MHAGYLDTFEEGILRGWAYYEGLKSPTLDVFIDGQFIGSFVACQYRADIQKLGYGDGYAGFYFAIPPFYFDGIKHKLEIFFHENGVLLKNGSQHTSFNGVDSEIYRLLNERIASDYYWFLQRVDISDNLIKFNAWALSPFNRKEPSALSINGVFVENLQVEEDLRLSKRFRFNKAYVMHGHFNLKNLKTDEAYFKFSCYFGHIRDYNPKNDFYYPLKEYPHPGIINKTRVQGKGSDENSLFDIQGVTIAKKIENRLKFTLHLDISASLKILDWGCGCGRVARFFSELTNCDFYGVDIDIDNVNWCKTNIKGNFSYINQEPPTQFPDHTFDVIYGISIFTHLNFDDHIKWLKELHRILRPGGYLLFTIHGDMAWYHNNAIGSNAFTRLHKVGMLDTGKCWHLDSIDVDHDRYRNIFLSREFIYNHWSNDFKIIDIIEGDISSHHDLVIVQAEK
jgi:SAM-dependent methyltransferase